MLPSSHLSSLNKKSRSSYQNNQTVSEHETFISSTKGSLFNSNSNNRYCSIKIVTYEG